MKRSLLFISVGAALLLGVAAAACSNSGVSQAEYDSVKSQLDASKSQAASSTNALATAQAESSAAKTQAGELQGQVSALQSQLKSAGPSMVVQAPTALDPSKPVPAPTGWDTVYSVRSEAKLLATYDSSGPAAWDATKHPVVFVTSEGNGYAGFYSEKYKVAGFQVIDAKTKEIVGSAGFDLGYKSMGTPHGLGVSPDGKWIYVPTTDGVQPWQLNNPNGGRVLVVDAKTFKLAQVIQTKFGPHHVKGFTDFKGRDRIIVETQGGDTLLLDPKDNNRVVLSIGPNQLFGQLYQVDADPAGKNLYFGLVLGGRGVAAELEGAVAKYDLDSGRITFITNVGMYPNGFAFTQDGKYTYVADSSGDRVYKIDNATSKAIGSTQAAVPGPYMIELSQDETQLWVVGKGEMTYNLGGSLGLIDTKTFTAVRDYNIQGQTIDHNLVNPADPTELWVTSSGTADTIVFDMVKRQVKVRIASANGGDTHSGAFVGYNPDFTGQLLNDNSGIRGVYQKDTRTKLGVAVAEAR